MAISGSAVTSSRAWFRAGDRLDRPALPPRRDPRGRAQVQDRLAAGAKRHPLVGRGQETAPPVDRPAPRPARARLQDDEAGQVGRLAADAVGDPRAHARPAELHRAGVGEQLGRRMVEDVGRHRFDDRQVIDDLRPVRQERRDPRPRFAVPGELADCPQQLGMLLGEHVHEREPAPLDERVRDRLAAILLKLGLVVEQLELARTAGHEQVDDALGPRGQMPGTRRQRIRHRAAVDPALCASRSRRSPSVTALG